MTSLRSHFRQHLKQSDSTNPQHKPSTRIPTNKSNHADANKSGKAPQHTSKLAKRTSKSITADPNADKAFARATPAPAPALASAPTSVVAAHNATAENKRLSVTSGGIPVPSARYSSNAFPAPPTIRTPSLVSGSSVSTFDSPRSNGLRRKPSGAIDRYVAQRRAESAAAEDVDRTMMDSRNAFDDTVLGISFPHVSAYDEHTGSMEYLQNSYDKQSRGSSDRNAAHEVSAFVPAPSWTPSTRYTDSPFSHAPTPSSASSYSPALVASSGPTTRQRPSSPTRSRLPLSGRTGVKDSPSRPGSSRARETLTSSSSTSVVKAQATNGLPPVRESSTSSSNSTVKVQPGKPQYEKRGASSSQQADNSSPAKPRAKRLSKMPPASASAKEPAQVPPELAHLNVDVVPKLSEQKSPPPIRPSRDGTPDLVGMEHQSNIVQSDLPRLYTTYHKRTPSQETPVSAPSPSLKSRFGFSPKGSLRGESPRIDSAISQSPAMHTLSRGSTPDIAPEDAPLRRRDSPAVVPPSPSKPSRFGFFSRKSKNDVSKTTEKPKRAPTKGPVAGTGHEGYGRYAFRGRSGSTTSSNGLRSPSTDSGSSFAPPRRPRQGSMASKAGSDASDLDDFLRERLNPVILRGSGSTISRTISNSDVPSSALPKTSSETSSLDSFPPPRLLPSALQKSRGMSPAKRSALGMRRPSDSSDDGAGVQLSSRANRTSFIRSPPSHGVPSTRIPPPINTNLPRLAQSIDSNDAETSALTRTDSIPTSDDPLHGREGLWLRPSKPEPPKPEPPKSTRKLNFFQRALAVPRAKGKERATETIERRPSLTQQTVTPYAMLNPVQSVGLEEVGRMAADNDTSTEESTSDSNAPPKMVPYEQRHTSLLPQPPAHEFSNDSDFRAKPIPPRIMVDQQIPTSSPELLNAQPLLPVESVYSVDVQGSPSLSQLHVFNDIQDARDGINGNENTLGRTPGSLSTPELNGTQSPKQPRLSPVGRIPKVVSKRDRDRKLPDNSFSRPFARHQPRPSSVKPPGSVYSQIREMASPIEGGSQGSQPVSSTSGAPSDETSIDPSSSVFTHPTSQSTNRTSMEVHAQSEFLAIARKDSDVSFSTSSGIPSWMSSFYAHPTIQQEDVWNEYNDFMDEVIPIYPKSPSTASSLGTPFQYANVLNDDSHSAVSSSYFMGPAPTTALPMLPGAMPTQTVLSVPQQISQFLHPGLSPVTPDTLSGFISGYGSRSTSTLVTSNRASLPAAQRSHLPQPVRSSLTSVHESVSSSRHSRSSTHSRSMSLPESTARNSQSSLTANGRFNRETSLMGIAESDGCDASSKLANVRRGALMTSKWLSFGRVLFSPAHNEVQFTDEPRVLVVDGLSSDWSYYVALSHPSATVYNLNLDGTDPKGLDWPDAGQKPPTNHRDIRLSSISASFPFPKGFFTAVVFRFPPASSEQAYQACISECKRVLRPGGYLEVAVLDLDLVHMSTKARKAVRDLKTRMQQRDRDISLQNLSDVLVRLIGRRGFEGVQRCVVGVPAAGRIPRSRDGSSVSSDGSGRPIWQREDRDSADQVFSFADLMEDSRNSQFGLGKRNDESITKMVAKVGRWWYSACYERSLPPGDRSIWGDRALLRECEKEGTSFRLLICHAQKPAQTRRRTVSV